MTVYRRIGNISSNTSCDAKRAGKGLIYIYIGFVGISQADRAGLDKAVMGENLE